MDIENKKEFVTYIEAQEIANRFSIKSREDWFELRKTHSELRIPRNPDLYYKNDWENWSVFLKKETIEFATYIEAKKIAKQYSIKSLIQWYELSKSHPELRIPQNPYLFYKDEWEDWYKFLGKTKNSALFLSYEEASDFIKKSNIKTSYMYREFQKEYAHLPSDPKKIYDEWESWDKFLGTNKIAQSSKIEKIIKKSLENVLNFGELFDKTHLVIKGKRISLDMADFSKQIAIEYDGSRWHQNGVERDQNKNKLLEYNGWTLIRIREEPLPKINDKMDLIINKRLPYSKVNEFIHLILNHLYVVIDDDEIREKIKKQSDVDFSKYNYLDIDKESNYLSYEECKDLASKHNIKTLKSWYKFVEENQYKNIPTYPDQYYRGRGWESWYVFFDKSREDDYKYSFVSYKECQEFALKNNITSSKEWKRFIKNNRPDDIPSSPHDFYNKTGDWTSWFDFLKKPKDSLFVSYQECKEIALKNNIKSVIEWKNFVKENKLTNVPSCPTDVYKKSGEWISWFDFLTKPDNSFVSYLEAKEIAKRFSLKNREDWTSLKQKNSELMIPRHPDRYYKNDWEGWDLFLDKKTKKLKHKL